MAADGSYTAGFLTAGTYTLAWTCDAVNDDPEANDTLTFVGLSEAMVSAGATTTVDVSATAEVVVDTETEGTGDAEDSGT